jgi:hypothetical protein
VGGGVIKSINVHLINAVLATLIAIILTLGAAVGVVDDLTAIVSGYAAFFAYLVYLYAPEDGRRPDDDDDSDSGHNQPETLR